MEQARTRKRRACRKAGKLAAVRQLRQHRAVARQQNPGIESERPYRGGQGRADIGQAAGLDQGGAFRGGEQDAQLIGVRGWVGSGGRHGFGSPRHKKALLTRPMLAGVRISDQFPGPGRA